MLSSALCPRRRSNPRGFCRPQQRLVGTWFTENPNTSDSSGTSRSSPRNVSSPHTDWGNRWKRQGISFLHKHTSPTINSVLIQVLTEKSCVSRMPHERQGDLAKHIVHVRTYTAAFSESNRFWGLIRHPARLPVKQNAALRLLAPVVSAVLQR